MNGTVFLFSLWILAMTHPFGSGQKYRFDYTYDAASAGWYKVHIIPTTWNEARLRCEQEGAVLASPTDSNILSAMVSRIKKLENEETVYTGISARFYRGHFYSIEGIPLIRMNLPWVPNEPNNYKNNETCIVLTKTGCIADIHCWDVFPYICYKKAPEVVTLNECGTIDNEYKLFPATGSCYKFHVYGRNWTRAFMTCSGEGGYLAIPNSKEEAIHLGSLIKTPNNPLVHKTVAFLGFSNLERDDQWTTIHGQPLEKIYYEWNSDEPTSYFSNQYCGAIYPTGGLDDMWCNNVTIFICEKDPKSLI